MSGEDDFATRARRLDVEGRRALLDDLEAVRDLLGEDADPSAIPVLRDVIGHASPGSAPGPGAASPAPPPDEDQGDLFDPRAFADQLLDDDWTEERERILADAKAGVEAFSLGLDEASRREREARLRAAVAERLAPRMEQILGEALDHLRTRLASLVRQELDTLLAEVFGPTDDPEQQRDQEP